MGVLYTYSANYVLYIYIHIYVAVYMKNELHTAPYNSTERCLIKITSKLITT